MGFWCVLREQPQEPHCAGSGCLLVPSLLGRWSALARELEAALQCCFYPDAVEEWLEENVAPSTQQLQALLRDLSEAAGGTCWDPAQDPEAGGTWQPLPAEPPDAQDRCPRTQL